MVPQESALTLSVLAALVALHLQSTQAPARQVAAAFQPPGNRVPAAATAMASKPAGPAAPARPSGPVATLEPTLAELLQWMASTGVLENPEAVAMRAAAGLPPLGSSATD